MSLSLGSNSFHVDLLTMTVERLIPFRNGKLVIVVVVFKS